MIAKFRVVEPRVLDVLARDPSLARLLTMYSQVQQKEFVPDQAYLANLPPELRAGLEASVAKQSGLTGPAATQRLAAVGLLPTDLFDVVSIEKAWHGVHFVLARTLYEPTEPPGDAILGGSPMGEDLGYGPVRIRTAQDVARTAAALFTIDLDQLRRGINPAELDAAQIYPGGWHSEAEASAWIMHSVGIVRDLYVRSAANGHAMLLFIV
jgi:hypothetical protein